MTTIPSTTTQSPTAAPTLEPEVTHEIVGIGSILFVLIILITLFSGKLIAIFRIHYLNESTISIIFGIIIGIIVLCFPDSSTNLFEFDAEFFFYVLLPPIVFEAGYNLKRKHFFRNMTPILIYAVIGTVLSCSVIGFGLYVLSFIGILPLFNDGNPLECLLFGALISAVDPVGTLSVLGKKELNVDPTLYSLIFGESVLNDAVSIVLYKIFMDLNNTQIVLSFESHFLVIIGQFLGIFIGSIFIGLVIALCASAILRHVLHLLVIEEEHAIASMARHGVSLDHDVASHHSAVELEEIAHSKAKEVSSSQSSNSHNDDSEESSQSAKALVAPRNLDQHVDAAVRIAATERTERMSDLDPAQDIIYLDEYRHHESSKMGESPSLEFAIIILLSFLSYSLGEIFQLSGIVAVFSCGICMSHYAWYNLTWVAQISFHHIITAMSKCCENFVYVYLGISMVESFYSPDGDHEPNHNWNAWLIIFTLILCVFSRAVNIFPLSFLINLKRRHKITRNMQCMMFFSGLRGAIAFALALNLNTPHSELIVTTTLSIVIITTILLGCTTKFMLDKLGLNNNRNRTSCDISDPLRNQGSPSGSYPYLLHTGKYSDAISVEHDMAINENELFVSSPEHALAAQNRPGIYSRIHGVKHTVKHALKEKYHGVQKFWNNFDTHYMQKWFGGPTNPYMQDRNIEIYSNRKQTSQLPIFKRGDSN
eukprot:CAMPEP_0202704216 /NCGR_PEP_ID=MMETSP1385-20130828/16931_1 /ASSEMBLY_ACC=CAM_ASM_000861 /TAXON_ID=933848 /ORGANISM="Elphidium margaritaceum" /LENGTH=707 /DNA_ID=CAMNT_0049362189 /DNA_START=45 /DNA_END=2168 /DNA_ORIENTATION=-